VLLLHLELYAGYPGVLEKLRIVKLTRSQELAKSDQLDRICSRRPHH
jgi:hypothetical protein